MSDLIPIGLVLTAKDEASPSVRKVGGALGDLKDTNEKNSKSMLDGSVKTRSFARTITGLHSAVMLAKMGFQAIERVIGSFIKKSLEFRYSWDPSRKEVENFQKTIDVLQARIGDAFMPILLGLARGLTPIIANFQKWVGTNKELVSGGTIEFLANLARILVSGVVAGAKLGIFVWMALKTTINTAVLALGAAVLALVQPLRLVLDQLPEKAKAMLGPLINVGNAIEAVVKGMKDDVVDGVKDWAKQSAAIDKTADSVSDVITNVENFGKAVKASNATANESTKEYEASLKQLGDAWVTEMEAAFAHTRALEKEWLADVEADMAKKRAVKLKVQFAIENADLHRMFSEGRAKIEQESKQFELNRAVAVQKISIAIDTAEAEGSFATILSAWRTFNDNVGMLTEEQARDQEKKLRKMTENIAKNIAGTISGVINTIRAELATVGSIQENSVQRIAIKGREHLDKVTKSQTRDVERYVDHISKAEIAAIRATGREVEVVNDTLEIRTKNTFDAILAGFKSLLDAIIAKLIEFAALAVVGLFLNVATGGGLSFGGVIAGASKEALGFAEGGLVQGPGGTDRVPAMLTAGEFVLPKPVVDSIRSSSPPSAPGSFSSGGFVSPSVPPAGSRAEPSVTMNMNFLAFTSSRAQVRKLERDVFGPERKRLARNRVISEG